jgi:acetyltransferase-like isoleucine patch superfamily enzyme
MPQLSPTPGSVPLGCSALDARRIAVSRARICPRVDLVQPMTPTNVTPRDDSARSLTWGRLLLSEVSEMPVRMLGWCATLVRCDRYGVEAALRGFLLGGSHGWRIGRAVQFHGPPARIRFGHRVCLYGNTIIDANGPDGYVTIGTDSHVDHLSVLYGQGGLRIGEHCAIASGTLIYTQTNADSRGDGTFVACQPTVYAAVELGPGCWLGAGVRVLPGVRIGAGTHVGAGAVVTKSLPPDVTAVGVPARIVMARGPGMAATRSPASQH